MWQDVDKNVVKCGVHFLTSIKFKDCPLVLVFVIAHANVIQYLSAAASELSSLVDSTLKLNATCIRTQAPNNFPLKRHVFRSRSETVNEVG